MFRRALASVAFVSIALSHAAVAQVSIPVPEKPKPAPEWTPPPKPAPTAAKPKPEVVPDLDNNPPDISIIERDGDKVVRLHGSPEAAAALKVAEKGTLECRTRVSETLGIRRAQVQQIITRLPTEAMKLREAARALGEDPTDEQLAAATDALKDLALREALPNMLKGRGALTSPQVAKVNAAVVEYKRELNKVELKRYPPNDLGALKKVAQANAVRNNQAEILHELDTLLVRVAGRWTDLRSAANLTAAQTEAISANEAKVRDAKTDTDRADAMAAVLGQLSGQQRKLAFGAVADTLPEGEKAATLRGK